MRETAKFALVDVPSIGEFKKGGFTLVHIHVTGSTPAAAPLIAPSHAAGALTQLNSTQL